MSENESSYGWWIKSTINRKEEKKKLYERRNIKYPGDIDTKIKTKNSKEIVYKLEELKWHN
tara:strand:- start:16 stop:198 length:183 start_codon:yes stop_codon:yes gene_type:complete